MSPRRRVVWAGNRADGQGVKDGYYITLGTSNELPPSHLCIVVEQLRYSRSSSTAESGECQVRVLIPLSVAHAHPRFLLSPPLQDSRKCQESPSLQSLIVGRKDVPSVKETSVLKTFALISGNVRGTKESQMRRGNAKQNCFAWWKLHTHVRPIR